MENNSGSSMFPFISGLIAGAVLGILFAPDKGSETRRKVMSTIGDLSEMTGIGSQEEEEYEGSSYSNRHSSSHQGSSFQGQSAYSTGGTTSGSKSHQ
jgi:gas vesicle protein